MIRTSHGLVALGLAVLVLSACASPAGLAEFDSKQVASDEITALGWDDPTIEFVNSSSRQLWSGDGTTVFLAQGAGGNEGLNCLIIVESGHPASACTARLPLQTRTQSGARLMLTTTPPPTSEGWVQVSSSLWIVT